MSASLMDDISRLEQRLSILPSNNVSAVHLTKRLYIRGLIDRAMNKKAGDKLPFLEKLLDKVQCALSELETGLEQQKHQAQAQLDVIEEEHEDDFENAKSLFKTQSYSALKCLFETVRKNQSTDAFKALINEMGKAELRVPLSDQTVVPGKIKQNELQSFQQYQTMFEKMALDRLLARVMKEIPENAGPLNPERLVIRSFKALQEISPDYLSQLISYYESLLTLQLINNADK